MNSQANIEDCLELMQKLIEYRYQKALHHQLMKAADHSMLGIDVLVLIYHFAKVSEGRHPRDRFLCRRVHHRRRFGCARFGQAEENHQHRTRRPTEGPSAREQGHLQRPEKEPGTRRFAGRRHLDQWLFFRGEHDQRGPGSDGTGRNWPVYLRCGFERPTRYRLLRRQVGESVLDGDRRLLQCHRQGRADPGPSGRTGRRRAVSDSGILRLGHLDRSGWSTERIRLDLR